MKKPRWVPILSAVSYKGGKPQTPPKSFDEFERTSIKPMNTISRRTFVRSTALAAAALTAPRLPLAQPAQAPAPVRLGIATYTFRNFTRAQMLPWLKQLNVPSLNCKDTKDHLPIDAAAESQPLSDYPATAAELHTAG